MSKFQKGETVFLNEDFAGHSEDSDHEVLDVDDDAEESTYFIFNDSFDDCFDVAVPESKLLSVEEYRIKLAGKRRSLKQRFLLDNCYLGIANKPPDSQKPHL